MDEDVGRARAAPAEERAAGQEHPVLGRKPSNPAAGGLSRGGGDSKATRPVLSTVPSSPRQP